MDRQVWRAAVHWGCKESDTTEQLNGTELTPVLQRRNLRLREVKTPALGHTAGKGRAHALTVFFLLPARSYIGDATVKNKQTTTKGLR